MAGLPRDEVIDWLMAGDVAIQYQTSRDLLDEERPDLRARIATQGWGARFLAAQNSDGSWGRGFYMPKWTSSHYTLLDLKNLGIDPRTAAIRDSILTILETERRSDGGMGPGASVASSDVCVAGMVLNYASYFGMPEARLTSVVDFLLHERMQDGGFNCRSNRSEPHHSSLHSTISVLEGFQQFLEAGYRWRETEIRDAMASSRAFILVHRLFRSDHTGAIIRPDFLRFPYPFRWQYNILRALDHFASARAGYDDRLQEALDRVAAARRPDGRWNVNAAHSGEQHFVMEKAGQPSRWITLIAMRVLRQDAFGNRERARIGSLVGGTPPSVQLVAARTFVYGQAHEADREARDQNPAPDPRRRAARLFRPPLGQEAAWWAEGPGGPVAAPGRDRPAGPA